MCGLVLTVLYEDAQGLGVTVFSGDRQGSHPVAVSGIDLSSMSEKVHQNICTPHLVQGWRGSKGRGSLWSRDVGRSYLCGLVRRRPFG